MLVFFGRHTVVTTVRSKTKGDQILAAHSGYQPGRLSYVIVSDIASRGAFDKVSLISNLPCITLEGQRKKVEADRRPTEQRQFNLNRHLTMSFTQLHLSTTTGKIP